MRYKPHEYQKYAIEFIKMNPIAAILLDIYQVLPEIIELWGLNVQTQVESKKNFDRLTGK